MFTTEECDGLSRLSQGRARAYMSTSLYECVTFTHELSYNFSSAFAAGHTKQDVSACFTCEYLNATPCGMSAAGLC